MTGIRIGWLILLLWSLYRPTAYIEIVRAQEQRDAHSALMTTLRDRIEKQGKSELLVELEENDKRGTAGIDFEESFALAAAGMPNPIVFVAPALLSIACLAVLVIAFIPVGRIVFLSILTAGAVVFMGFFASRFGNQHLLARLPPLVDNVTFNWVPFYVDVCCIVMMLLLAMKTFSLAPRASDPLGIRDELYRNR